MATKVNVSQELRELAQDAITITAAAEALLASHPTFNMVWARKTASDLYNRWCREGFCERQRIDGQPTVFQMRQTQ